jgi:5-methylcytosine-specific restriction endonuclease McrA
MSDERHEEVSKTHSRSSFGEAQDVMEIDHLIPIKRWGTDESHNFQLLHRHCHDRKTARDIDR